MSILLDSFREKTSKLKDQRMKAETEPDVYYSTGFLSFDFMNGCKVHPDNIPEHSYYSVGIQDGSINMLIGRSGCGKTTWALQAASNIIKPFANSCIFEDSIEGGITMQRRITLSGFTPQEISSRFVTRNTGITTENVYERIKMIHDEKLEKRDSLLYNTGLYDANGEYIYKLEPTVYIIDSLALLMPDKFTDEDEMSGQMSATATAKANALLFKRITPMLKMANIIVFVINHINQKVEIDRFHMTKSQVSYLKQNETLPGGNTPIYMTNNMIRFDDSTKLKSEKDFYINGSIVDVSLLKSRSASVNQSVPLVFDYANGFDVVLSLYLVLKNSGAIKGAGAYFYIEGAEQYKFAQKNFRTEVYNNQELCNIFISKVREVLKKNLDDLDSKIISKESSGFMLANQIMATINQ